NINLFFSGNVLVMTDNFDDILGKLFDKSEEKEQPEDCPNSEQLDLFNVDFAHNRDLQVDLKQKN
uniref:hypothetical protein n=1 Tax=Lactobacillus jensenii TaxID=109790 RepID=UPI0028701926